MYKLANSELGRLNTAEFQQKEKFPLVLVLDNVRSALNVGSIFRTADAFACERIVLCGITAQPPHREILKTALGSTDSVSWAYNPSALEAVQQLRAEGYAVYAIEQAQPRIWLQDFHPEPNKRFAVILGNEVDGVAAELLPLCDGVIEIPQFGTKHSLNVAVAAGVAVWEMVKKMGI